MATNTIEDDLDTLMKLREVVDQKIRAITQVLDSELFVPVASEEGVDIKNFREIGDWLFENNIVSKLETIESKQTAHHMISLPRGVYHGFTFRTAEDAMAFKLRWK